MNTSTTFKTEQQLLEMVAHAIAFNFLMYVHETYPHQSGLLYKPPGGRQRVWNPLLNNADLLQLAVAAPTVNLHDIIAQAAAIDGDEAARHAYVREAFVRAVTLSVVPMAETPAVIDNATPAL
ncbi:hypothetical protein [Massilia putida]|uniref:hypothetical protein n=1 Tax=Massilia putida TaxID=1141883 RepID=UPI0009514AFD|nr:hypothetical protein [Massilia putida]